MDEVETQEWRTVAAAIAAYRRTLEQHGVESDADAQFWRDARLTPLLNAELARRLLGVRSFLNAYGQQYDRFRMLILRTFDSAGSVEDGMLHRAEHDIREALEADTERVRGWLRTLVAEQFEQSPWHAAQLLHCIGRCDLALVGDLGVELIRSGLRHSDVLVRDAAVQAIEQWMERDATLVAELRPDEESNAHLAATMRALIASATSRAERPPERP